MADTLYETDFYEWTQQKSELLRQRAAASNALDYENLAEEIGDIGRSNLNACKSLVRNILLHFLKLTLSVNREPERHWRAEIVAFRVKLEDELSPSLRARFPDLLDDIYAGALRLFLRDVDDAVEAPPETCPWAWDDVLGRGADWQPGD